MRCAHAVKWLSSLVFLLVCLAGTRLAQAQEELYDPLDLARERLELVSSQVPLGEFPLPEALNGCRLLLRDRRIVPDGSVSTCPRVWAQTELKPFELTLPKVGGGTLKLTFAPRALAGTPAGLSVEGRSVRFEGLLPEAHEVAVFNYDSRSPRWGIERVGQGQVALSPSQLSRLERGGLLLYYRAADQLRAFRVKEATAEAPVANASPGDADFCGESRPWRGYHRVCFDASLPAIEPTLPDGSVLLPNRPIVVIVRNPSGLKLKVAAEGTMGTYIPALQSPTVQAGGEEAGVVTSVPMHFPFAPRKPGPAKITATFNPGEKGAETVREVELLVEKTYAGAFRLGVAPIFGNAVDRSYAGQLALGSDQYEVVATSFGQVDVELVVGFAPFLETLWGGRSYTSLPMPPADSQHLGPLGKALYALDQRIPLRLAPFFGVGVLSPGIDSSVDIFKSLHVGLEWEFSQNASVAVTYVWRRVNRLPDGMEIGSPVDGETVPMVQGFSPGVGVVLNVGPEFFKLAGQATSWAF